VGATAVMLLAHVSLSLEAAGPHPRPRPVAFSSLHGDPTRVEGPLPPVVARHALRGAWLADRGPGSGLDVPAGTQGRAW
jgi:hypothetical protein